MLMLIGDWYVNREDVVIGRTSTVAAKLPNGVRPAADESQAPELHAL
jgi:hypothetical protein